MQKINQLLSYANAIFSIASSKDMQEKYYQQIIELDGMNTTNKDFYNILSARTIDKDERKDLAMTILNACGFDSILIYWIWTIIDNNQYCNYHQIALLCREVYHNIFNIVDVKIISANELSENQINKIKDFFEKKLSKKIDIQIQIKPNLIGGLKIQINNKTYNNTFKSKLNILKKELLSRKDNYGN